VRFESKVMKPKIMAGPEAFNQVFPVTDNEKNVIEVGSFSSDWSRYK
jgi:hypothetical protein